MARDIAALGNDVVIYPKYIFSSDGSRIVTDTLRLVNPDAARSQAQYSATATAVVADVLSKLTNKNAPKIVEAQGSGATGFTKFKEIGGIFVPIGDIDVKVVCENIDQATAIIVPLTYPTVQSVILERVKEQAYENSTEFQRLPTIDIEVIWSDFEAHDTFTVIRIKNPEYVKP